MRERMQGSMILVMGAAVLMGMLLGPAVTAQSEAVRVWLANGGSGNGLEVAKALTLPYATVATTLTARNLSGVLQAVKPAAFSVVSFPSSGTVASASIGAEAAVRHVADCVTWGADSSAAVTAAAGNLALRDGAAGAGTVIWQMAIATAVAAGAGVQTKTPGFVCGLNLAGTTNTAMTAEFSAGVTGEVQSVTLTGYNVTTP